MHCLIPDGSFNVIKAGSLYYEIIKTFRNTIHPWTDDFIDEKAKRLLVPRKRQEVPLLGVPGRGQEALAGCVIAASRSPLGGVELLFNCVNSNPITHIIILFN